MTMTQEFAQFVATRSPDWPQAARSGAARGFVDTIACMIAGRDDDATRRVRATLAPWSASKGAASIAGPRLPAPWAALINATAAHALDYDDVLEPALSHVSAALVPALLALGEERGASGGRLIDAYLIGFDVQAALAAAMNMGHYARGWHTTLTFGAPSAAAACARLLGLDAARSAAAISAATSFASGAKKQFGTNMKPVHAGLAAQAGILAACLAEQGITAAPEIFEGEWSYGALFGAPGAPGFDAARAQLAGPSAMTSHGAWLKAHPCCASAHRPIDAIRAMRRKGLRAADVESIEAEVSEIVMRNLMYETPTDDMQARFSLNHCLALALTQDEIRVRDFRPDRLARAELRAIWPRVSMRLYPTLPGSMAPKLGAERTRVVVTCRDGSRREETIVFPRGHPQAPMSDADLGRKFIDCANGAMSARAMANLVDALFGLDKLDGIGDIANAIARLADQGS